MHQNLKICIVDDHALLRSGIRMSLHHYPQFEIVGEASNGEEALRLAAHFKPDLMILDISMPEPNGLEVCRELARSQPEIDIIILSMYLQEEYISKSLEYGVKGYVAKDTVTTELVRALDIVSRGGTYLSPNVNEVVIRKYQRSLGMSQKEFFLTQREREVLRLVASGKSSAEVSEELFISPRTVDTHRSNIMKKLKARNSVELVNKAKEMGVL
jgi:DNA-binding NarL/FixJ family response regulator